MRNFEQWNGFKGNRWKEKIDVRNFISMNYTPYEGDASFLEEPTEATNKLWDKLQALQKEERAKGGVLDMETEVVTSLTAYGPGYIDEETKDLEKVVGLQTDKPLKRAFMPYGGIKMAEQACETYGYHVSDKIKDVFYNYEFKTHNQGVFDIYRSSGYLRTWTYCRRLQTCGSVWNRCSDRRQGKRFCSLRPSGYETL